MKIAGLLLAAGFSGRMKRFKPLLEIGNKPFVIIITQKLLSVCDKVFVVTGYKDEKIRNVIDSYFSEQSSRIEMVHNADYESGMFSSLKAGLNSTTDFDWFFYHFIDQPGLELKFYQSFINEIDNNYNWIQPVFNERRGHPLLFDSNVRNIILNEKKITSLRDLQNRSEIKRKYWECGTDLIFQDIDTPSDYNLFKYPK